MEEAETIELIVAWLRYRASTMGSVDARLQIGEAADDIASGRWTEDYREGLVQKCKS
jgi:hypothetical protein